MLLITASTDDQSQTEHFVLSISTGLPCKFFSIYNGEENKLTSATAIAKVDICFLLASTPLPWVCRVSQRVFRVRSALCRAFRDKGGRISSSEPRCPFGVLPLPFWKTSGSFHERLLSSFHPETNFRPFNADSMCGAGRV